jgi:AcrR family transcriptional regulator
MQKEQDRGASDARREIMEAMLVCCGEIGFRDLSVEQVAARYGGYRSHFYRYFQNKSECFLAAYEWKANQLADCAVGMLEEKGSAERRLRRALEAVASLIVDQEALAKAVFVGVHVAGRDAFLKRKEIIDRLSVALDAACREEESDVTPPPLTAEFLVNAVDQAVATAILAGRPDDFAEAIPELVLLISLLYGRAEAMAATGSGAQEKRAGAGE